MPTIVLDDLDNQTLLRQLGEAQHSTFIVKDLEHRYVLVNRRFADSVGLSVEEIVGRNDLEIGIPERMVLGDEATGFPGFWALDDAAIAAGEPLRRHESGVAYAEGSAHEADTVRTPILDAGGTPIALLIQSHDVSDMVTLRQNLAGRDETLAARDGQLGALADVMTMLTETLVTEHELAPLLDRIAEAVVVHTAADEAWLWMCDGRGERLTVVAGVGADREAALGRSRKRGEGLVGRAWELDGTLYIADAAEHPATRPYCTRGTEVVSLPLRGEHDISGLLTVNAPPGASGQRLEHELALLEKVAELASIAIANAQRMDAAKAELRRTCALTRLGRLLSATQDPEEDLDAVCHALTEAIDITRASVYFADEDGVLGLHAAWTIGADGSARALTTTAALAHESSAHASVAAWSHASGKPVRIGREEDGPREPARVRAARRELDTGAICCAPIVRGGRAVGSLLIARSSARPDFDDAEAELCGAVVDLLSIALERHSLSVALEHQAFHDSLTRLPNRRQFERDLAASLAESRHRETGGAVMFLDLDGFKLVNDNLGHAVGDTLLRQVAGRLAGRLKGDDVLARMGGDEFAVLLPELENPDDALDVARRLIESFGTPFDIDGARLRVGTSVGISHYPRDGISVDALLRHADAAMYRAKHAGKGRVVCFDHAIESDARRHAELEFELRDALVRGQFRLVYQPQVSCATGRVEGVEALIRWEHPERGTISPVEFIPIAEEAGLINAIGAWVLDEALRERASWRGTELDALRVSVNISAPQFLLDNFTEHVLAALGRHGVAPAHLELEVTESIVMNDLDAVAGRLNALRTAGVRIAIDDFGTGYSSLGYLQDLPLDVLKIDRSFVNRLQDENGRHSLVNTILLLASGLGLETVAEGVETGLQQERVTALGCHLVQGYLHSRPVPPAELVETVRRIEADVDPDTAIDRAA